MVTITVTDVNEPPAFADDAPATQSVAEKHRCGNGHRQPIHGHRPRRRETLTYSLGGTDAASFDIYDGAVEDQGRPRP